MKHYFFAKAMNEIYAGKRWRLPGNGQEFVEADIDRVLKEDDFEIDKSIIMNRIQEMIDAEPMKRLRHERDIRLRDTDWRDLPSYQGADQEAWRTYRQALRDLPQNSSPQLDERQYLTNVTWPSEPE